MNREELEQKALDYLCKKYGYPADTIIDMYPPDFAEFAEQQTSELQTEIDRLKAENEELKQQVYKPKYIAANSIYTQYFVSQHNVIMTNYNDIDPITKETKSYECNVEIKAGHIYYPKITENGLEVIDLTT